MEKRNLKWWNLHVMTGFYVLAGLNHFINPDFYIGLIPPYLPEPELLNTMAGVAEAVFGGFLLYRKTRTWAALGIMAMLTAFIPAHVYMIQAGGCIEGSLCVPLWVAWLRLILVHPLLMYWAWTNRM
jgi:uncharacterized membrane protein